MPHDSETSSFACTVHAWCVVPHRRPGAQLAECFKCPKPPVLRVQMGPSSVPAMPSQRPSLLPFPVTSAKKKMRLAEEVGSNT